jgi:2-oxoglutarate ferredoxin oxidoreductase subunit beta
MAAVAEAPVLELKPLKAADYKTDVKPIWCPGCGDFGVLAALYQALAIKQLNPRDVVIVSGIGCSSRLPAFVKAYGFHSVHGRTLPVATGIKTANPKLTVIVVGGDGDAFAIGAGHIPHACRRNVDLTYVIMDNEIYGLTKGQASPTSVLGLKKDSTPYGTFELPMNPIAMALVYGASFIARGFSYRAKELQQTIVQAIDHRGFSFVQVMSPCPTYNDTEEEWKGEVTPLPADHNPEDKLTALKLAYADQKMYTGIFYKEVRSTLTERVDEIRDKALAKPATLETLFDRYA